MSKRELKPNKAMIEARKEKRMSQQDLAGRLGVSVSWVSKIEQGRENPSVELALGIVHQLEADPSELFPSIFWA